MNDKQMAGTHLLYKSVVRMKRIISLGVISLMCCVSAAQETQEVGATVPAAEDGTVAAMKERMEAAARRLTETRERIADEKIPLNKALAESEQTVSELRKEYDTLKRQSDGRTLEAAALRNEIKQRETERNYLSSLINEYARNFETRLDISELERYRDALDAVKTSQERLEESPLEAFNDQLCLLLVSLARLEEMSGGLAFEGRAAGGDGLVKTGKYLLFGPVAYFVSDDGLLAGIASQRVGSLMPVVEAFADGQLAEMIKGVMAGGVGDVPFDASLGNARKIEATKETLREHFDKGGPVMYPMLGLFGCCMLVAFLKWLGLLVVPMPGAKRLAVLLEAVSGKDYDQCRQLAAKLRGPAGKMLRAGCEMLEQPKELIEEAMFEKMLEAKFRLNRWLPFIAVTAACAPLLGLLGTVTGIISTFKLMTVFGSGDVKMLSSGISEALITTEFGLYIAIPAVMMHAFLSRKAKRLGDRMEQTAIRFMGAIGKV